MSPDQAVKAKGPGHIPGLRRKQKVTLCPWPCLPSSPTLSQAMPLAFHENSLLPIWCKSSRFQITQIFQLLLETRAPCEYRKIRIRRTSVRLDQPKLRSSEEIRMNLSCRGLWSYHITHCLPFLPALAQGLASPDSPERSSHKLGVSGRFSVFFSSKALLKLLPGSGTHSPPTGSLWRAGLDPS